MIRLTTPISEAAVRDLKVGDEILLNGRVVLSRDIGHKFMVEKKPDWLKPILAEAVIYHCGPVVAHHEDGHWSFVSSGPTTSIREEPYQADVLDTYTVRGVIGKGGMGEKTVEACKQHGCVYLHAVGGAAQVLADCIKRVPNVYFMEKFGAPEAIWEFEIVSFPAVVTIDAHGNSLHKEVFAASQAELAKYV